MYGDQISHRHVLWYFEGQIVLIFRQVGKNSQHNSLWVATRREDHPSLKAEIPSVIDFVFGEEETFEYHWLQLADGHNDFEETAIALCALISRRDPRIGKTTPKAIEFTRAK
ncbi:MAG: hypothetical protein V4592_07955 [Bacteroidota bacterium]